MKEIDFVSTDSSSTIFVGLSETNRKKNQVSLKFSLDKILNESTNTGDKKIRITITPVLGASPEAICAPEEFKNILTTVDTGDDSSNWRISAGAHSQTWTVTAETPTPKSFNIVLSGFVSATSLDNKNNARISCAIQSLDSKSDTWLFEAQPLSTYVKKFTGSADDKPFILKFRKEPRGLQAPNSIFTIHWTIDLCNVKKNKRASYTWSIINSVDDRVISIPSDKITCGTLKQRVTADTRFTLRGVSNRKIVASADLEVTTVSAGWRRLSLSYTEKDLVTKTLRPLAITTGPNESVLGVFEELTDQQGERAAYLYRTDNVLQGWTRISSQPVPQSVQYSPIIFHDSRIWLIGGPFPPAGFRANDGANSEVYYRKLSDSESEWTQAENPEENPLLSSKLIGHALVAFQNEIWILGGKDEDGRPNTKLSKISTEFDEGHYKIKSESSDLAKPLQRSHIACGVIKLPRSDQESLFVTGGLDAKQDSNESGDELWTHTPSNAANDEASQQSNSVDWDDKSTRWLNNLPKNALGSSLMNYRDKLTLLGLYPIESNAGPRQALAFSNPIDPNPELDGKDVSWRAFERPEHLNDFTGPFVLQTVEHGDLIVSVAIAHPHKDNDQGLYVYVPSNSKD